MKAKKVLKRLYLGVMIAAVSNLPLLVYGMFTGRLLEETVPAQPAAAVTRGVRRWKSQGRVRSREKGRVQEAVKSSRMRTFHKAALLRRRKSGTTLAAHTRHSSHAVAPLWKICPKVTQKMPVNSAVPRRAREAA